VIKGGNGDFYRYDIVDGRWDSLTRYDYKTMVNFQEKKKKIGDGAGLQYWYGNVYLLKGGNTCEFWKYTISSNTWTQMGPDSLWSIPLVERQKKVKGGGALVVLKTEKGRGEIYATKGNNTDEFYKHDAPAEFFFTISDNSTENVMGDKISTESFKLRIVPNPAVNITTVHYSLPITEPISFKFYNVAGVLVKEYTTTIPSKDGILMLDTKALPSGVYILRFNSGDIRVTRKLVLEK